jgi:DNA polymerase III epsilon subunit-like protein
MSKLTDMFQPKCEHRHTAKTHPKCFNEDGSPKTKEEREASRINKVRVLVFDVETLPTLAYTWGVWKVNITKDKIVKEECLLSFAAKWLGDDRIVSDVLTPKESLVRDDKRLCTNLWKLIEEADVVVTHNGKRFDIRKMNTRFWKHRLNRPSSYKVIDTLTTAKSVFGLLYNSMSYIAEFKEADQKLDTEFPLWIGCDNGDKDALTYMQTYNEQDVRTQEAIYMEMRGWMSNHPDLGVYEDLTGVCPVCCSEHHKPVGFYVAKSKKYEEHRCSDCGNVWHDTKEAKEKK